MPHRRRIGQILALVATAATGLLVAHEIDYRLVVPDPYHRHDLLLRTGHGYLGRAAFMILAAALLSILTSVATGFRRGRDDRPVLGYGAIATRLALIQGGSFVVLEAVERLIVGAPADDSLLMVSIVGVVVQIVAASIGAFVLILLERAGAMLARALPVRPVAGASERSVPVVDRYRAPRARLLVGATGIRGPPSSCVPA